MGSGITSHEIRIRKLEVGSENFGGIGEPDFAKFFGILSRKIESLTEKFTSSFTILSRLVLDRVL